VYGTPFADQKLQELEQGATARDTANQQAAFNLEEDQAMAPIRRQVQESLIPQREAAARLTEGKADAVEFANSDEMRGLKQQEAALKLQMLTNRDKRAEAMLGPQLAQIQARINKLNQPSTAGTPKPKRQYDATRGIIVDVNTGETSPVMGQDGAPLKRNLTSDAQNKIAILKGMQSSLGKLKSLAQGEAGKEIGYFRGKAVDATRGIFGASPEVQEMFNISNTLANEYMNAKSGAAISPQEAVRLDAVLPRATSNRSKFDADVKRFEIELANAIAARTGEELSQGDGGGIDPEVEKRLKALGL
jgi:hypothetical protein